MRKIILASSSQYRRQILKKLGLAFSSESPDIDESPLSNEKPEALVERLAIEKARALTPAHNDALIIGSDQVAVLDGQIMGKPHTHAKAFEQLRRCSGNSVTFFTGLCVIDAASHQALSAVEPFTVHFKNLSDLQINNYLYKEAPFDCAGSFKSEGLGIALFKALEGRDPNSLIGLPLILLIELLAQVGIDPLGTSD